MKHLKTALETIIVIVEKGDLALEDNKIDLIEAAGLAISGIGLVKVVKDAQLIGDEYMALTPAEQEELTTWFASEFDLRDENLEKIIEQVVGALLRLGDVIAVLQAQKNL